MRDIEDLFTNLAKSKFRSRFRLRGKEKKYLEDKGLETILTHGREFIQSRLAPACIPNDGRQTPMKNHPVFIAQHATATCCRSCLQKWHYIPKGHELSDDEVAYIMSVIKVWLMEALENRQEKGT